MFLFFLLGGKRTLKFKFLGIWIICQRCFKKENEGKTYGHLGIFSVSSQQLQKGLLLNFLLNSTRNKCSEITRISDTFVSRLTWEEELNIFSKFWHYLQCFLASGMRPVEPFLSWVMERVDDGARSVDQDRNQGIKNSLINWENKNISLMRTKHFRRLEAFSCN